MLLLLILLLLILLLLLMMMWWCAHMRALANAFRGRVEQRTRSQNQQISGHESGLKPCPCIFMNNSSHRRREKLASEYPPHSK